MITSIFSKSKPINIIIVSVYLVIVFLVVCFSDLISDFVGNLNFGLNLFLLLFTLFLLDFIISKNALTKKNSYAIMFFALLVGLFPDVFKNTQLIWSNLFVLFAIRRIISLHSKKNIKSKLFDAGFWVGLAALFNPWCLLYVIIILLALFYYAANDVKTIIVPLIGLLCVAVLKTCYNILLFDRFFLTTDFNFEINMNFTVFNNRYTILAFTLFFAFLIWSSIFYFKRIGDKNSLMKPIYYLIFWTYLIGILIGIINSDKTGSEFIYCFVPASIIMAAYFESIQESWFKNSMVLIFFLAPIGRFFL